MLALLLATHVAAAPMAAPPSRAAETAILPGAERGIIRIIRTLPAKACLGAGRLEAAWEPSALYRHGDRPPKLYVRWADYPDGEFCHAGGAP